jgi:hypothetical protein
VEPQYTSILGDISQVIDAARRSASRSVNSIMTAAYWIIGRRIVEFEQSGRTRADYGTALLENLSADLSQRYGRGFGVVNLSQMKKFFLLWPPEGIFQTPSEELPLPLTTQIFQTTSAELSLSGIASCFPLPWSAYVRLLSVKSEIARRFYETEALRGGWSVRQLDRQINSQFYERTALSRNKAAMLEKGETTLPEDVVRPEEEIKDPFVLEFLGFKDEYSETDLEEAPATDPYILPFLAALYAMVLGISRKRSNHSRLTTTTSAGISISPRMRESRAISENRSFARGSTTRKSRSLSTFAVPAAYEPNRITMDPAGAASNNASIAFRIVVSSISSIFRSLFS